MCCITNPVGSVLRARNCITATTALLVAADHPAFCAQHNPSRATRIMVLSQTQRSPCPHFAARRHDRVSNGQIHDHGGPLERQGESPPILCGCIGPAPWSTAPSVCERNSVFVNQDTRKQHGESSSLPYHSAHTPHAHPGCPLGVSPGCAVSKRRADVHLLPQVTPEMRNGPSVQRSILKERPGRGCSECWRTAGSA